MAAPVVSPGAALDGAIDVVVRHVGRAGLLQDGAQRDVAAEGSPPPARAVTTISLAILLKTLPLTASDAAFLCLMFAHLL
jgi:hypothetical protein